VIKVWQWIAPLCIAGALLGSPVLADRQPVLEQIDVPHNYYFREMYLPQLTSGPSSLAWSPDGEWLVYSMAGSLWKQRTDSSTTIQLTDGPGYDYQPDWSPDGKSLAFTRYDGQSLELMRLDLASAEVSPLTQNGAVNLEPRFSPDGTRLAFVTTQADGRFRVAVGRLRGGLEEIEFVLPQRQSATSRYYYSAWDHQISPSWSPDGKELLLVANPEVPYGTGSLWRLSLDRERTLTLVREEETSWQARPDWSPDGKRIIYSSYAGRQWHQPWVTTASGKGQPFPLGYGKYDVSPVRWSPTADRIAFISNEGGSLSLWIQEAAGGKRHRLEIAQRQYLNPMGTLHISTANGAGKEIPARISVRAADGRSYAPPDAWIHSDDGFDRQVMPYELQYFHSSGEAELRIPAGPVTISAWHGPEYRIERRQLDISASEATHVSIIMQPLPMPQEWSAMLGADVHVHMNYGGRYRNTPARLAAQARAEDLDVIFNLIVNKEQRIPDIAYFSVQPDPVSDKDFLLMHSQEFHTSFWGHLGVIGLREHYLLPDYVAYPNTAAASLYPSNATVADNAHAQGALVGYVHPFDTLPDPVNDPVLHNALPVDVALGKVDYFEVVGFSNHRITAEIWYRLLNCGFRLPAAGGTDAMANFSSLRGPVGQNRVYVDTGKPLADPSARQAQWLGALSKGRSMATNAPLLSLRLDDQGPGGDIVKNSPGKLKFSGYLRSNVPVDHLELVYNGTVAQSLELSADRMSADFDGEIHIDSSGWVLVRAWNEQASPDVLDLYPYATTSPVFVTVAGQAVQSAKDSAYFLAWIDRLTEAAASHSDYNTEAERTTTLAQIDRARRVFQAQLLNHRTDANQ